MKNLGSLKGVLLKDAVPVPATAAADGVLLLLLLRLLCNAVYCTNVSVIETRTC